MIASGTGKQDLLIVALGAVGIAAFTVLTQNNFYLDSLFSILLFAGMASAWNIVGGFAGQFSLGHTAFFGIGAYASTILLIKFGLTPWAGMLVGAVLAALAAAILGWSSFRLRGPFFSLATIAFAEVVRIVAVNWRQLTRGSEGLLVPIEREGWLFLNFTDKALYADAALGYLVVAFLVSRWVYRSKLGYQLQALREDEDAAAALGINVRAAKVKATALSAALTAVAGTLYAQYLLYINPEAVLAFNVSLQPAIMSIIGGLGTTLGPILGAFLIVPLGQLMRMWLGGAMHGLHLFVYGAVLVVVVLVIPQGVLGSVQRLITRVRGKVVAGRAGSARAD